jgi:Leucine-rich repeat (LRR) protein
MRYLLTILTSIQLVAGYIIKTGPSGIISNHRYLTKIFFLELDCSKYLNDEDIIHSFPFTVHANAAIQNTATTFAQMDDKYNVISLKIAYEECVPSSIYCLKSLSILKIVNTNFCYSNQQLPADIERLASTLTELYIDTKMTHLPNEIGKLKRLHKISIVNAGLKSLPNSIGDLPLLNVSILSNNSLSVLPRTMTKLQSLHHLTLSNNLNLYSIKSLNGHPSLRFLDTRNCPIEILPKNLPQLMALYMTNNKLKHLKGIESLGKATDGKKMFDFDGNRIKTITPRISYVRKLSQLNLRCNLLEVLPTNIFNISTLELLDIKSNHIPDRDLKKYIATFNVTNPNMKLFHD